MFPSRRSAAISTLCSIFVFGNTLGLISIVTSSTATAFPRSNETDRQALLAIKDLIPGDPFQVFRSWNQSIHFCKWEGVTCGRKHQRVTVLDLSSRRLVGSLSPYIGNLTFLRMINLGNNSFHGAIPEEIGRLGRLQYLLLLNNTFQGEVPSNLTHCSNIQVIALGQNNLGGEVPAWLTSLSSLIKLNLANNYFTGSISPLFGNLSALTALTFMFNNLGGNIPFELGQLRNLQFLQLTANNLSGTVPPTIYNISSLNFFGTTMNRLQGSLPPDFGLNLPNLEFFYIAANQFYGPIPSSIANATRLLKLEIQNNSFTGPIPQSMGNLKDLDGFVAWGNPFGTKDGNELENIITTLSNCSNLQMLSLGQNGFRGKLPHSIANLTNLITLDISTDFISGSIPRGIGNLVNLLTLGLNENMLGGSIPYSIGKLSKLVEIYIYRNNISGQIPSSVGNLTRLTLISLGDNKLEGIPDSLGNCTSLLGIDLGYNQLTGVIPEQIFGLSSLSIGLLLNHNQFSGPIPMRVGNLKNLGILDLSENELSGEIPATLSSFQVLESLSLAGNHLEGTIPTSFNQLKGIQVLDLSRNNLSGRIPTFFGEMTSLQNLNLSYNRFEGELPTEGLFKNISAFSVTGNQKLCGGVKELELSACPVKKRKRSLNYKVIVPLITTSVIVAVLLCLTIVIFRIRRSRQQASLALPLQDKYPKLSYSEILQATNGFSSTNLIGEGRYGSVFKGILSSTGQIVAVKILKLQERGGNKSFIAECEAFKNIRHRNLVKIITSCSSIDFKGNDFKALVFEFMENGSLDNWLYLRSLPEQQDTKSLNLVQRLNIAIDVVSALDYLHRRCEVAIIHCDLKPSNVLLDDDFCAHVSDFGLARILLPTTGLSINHQQSSSTGIRGTIGYVAPEYGMGDEISTRGDMYSYGVLLLEMFIGKRPTDNMFTDGISLPSYAKMSLPDEVMKIIDPLIIPEEEEQASRTRHNNTTNTDKLEVCLASILQIGVSCSAELPSERMNARDVLVELHKIRDEFLVVREQRRQDGRRNDS